MSTSAWLRAWGSTVTSGWRRAWQNPRVRWHLLASIGGLSVILAGMTRFLAYAETRPGMMLTDPVLALLPALDLSPLIFAIIYLSLVVGIAALLATPELLLVGLETYGLCLACRTLTIALLPLEPPGAMVSLVDPFVSFFTTDQPLTRDLFFSGHTSSMAVLYLTARHPALRRVFAAGTLLIGALVLVQHVHYTIDVLAAPPAALLCHVLVRRYLAPELYGAMRVEPRDGTLPAIGEA